VKTGKVNARILVLLLFLMPGVAIAATPTVEVVTETQTHVTYKITHEDGIQQLTFNYEAEGVEAGEVSMVNVVRRYRDCPRSVTITVEKEEALEGDNQLALLSRLMVENCQSQTLGTEFNKAWIFEILNGGGYDVAPQPMVALVPPSDPPPPELNFFEWRFWALFVWTVVTLYLLWWRIFGPFRPR